MFSLKLNDLVMDNDVNILDLKYVACEDCIYLSLSPELHLLYKIIILILIFDFKKN